MDSKASEAIGTVSCPGVENTRLINGRPADARFRVWVSVELNNSEEAKEGVSRVRSCPGVENTGLINGRPADARFRVWVSVELNNSEEAE